jgi:hypothetical protein
MESKFKKNINLKFAGILIVLLWAVPSFACSACFYGDPTQKSIVAVKWGVFTLLAAVVSVLFAFIKFFIGFNKRSQLSNKVKTI